MEDFYIKHLSEDVAKEFQLTHNTIVKWIRYAIKHYPQLNDSFEQAVDNKRTVYIIDEAGYDYLCNRFKGIKPVTRESEFKDTLIPFLNAMGYEVEYQKTILQYRVDFYIPVLNIVIEHDEEYHRQAKVSQYDIKREAAIKDCLHCEFVRIPAKYDYIVALGYIATKIVEKCLEIKDRR